MPMKPFLFLGTRPEDDVATGEYVAIRRAARLQGRELHQVRLEQAPLGTIDLEDWSGFILGGGPFNLSDPAEQKSEVQVRVESELRELAERVVAADFPFLGCCYGIGTLGGLAGGVVDQTHREAVGVVAVTLTEAGVADPLFGGLPRTFDAFVGHKEAVRDLPDGARVLAGSSTCPVQAFRFGDHVYATQFHPELDPEGLCQRIEAYRDHGYFDAAEEELLKQAARAAEVAWPQRLLARFVELYARPAGQGFSAAARP